MDVTVVEQMLWVPAFSYVSTYTVYFENKSFVVKTSLCGTMLAFNEKTPFTTLSLVIQVFIYLIAYRHFKIIRYNHWCYYI